MAYGLHFYLEKLILIFLTLHGQCLSDIKLCVNDAEDKIVN